MNEHMDHRGASGSDPATGDGAGMLIQMPDKFLRREMAKKGVELPPEGDYGSGCVFFSPEAAVREVAMQVFEHVIREEGQKFLGWRTVPVKSEILGKTSGRYEPVIKQVFIGKSADITDPMAFERKLYVIRKRVGAWIRNNEVPNQFRDVHGNKGNSFPGADYHYVTGPLRPHDGLQGHAHALPAFRVFPGFPRPGFRIGAGADAHPLLDQHLPELVARPP